MKKLLALSVLWAIAMATWIPQATAVTVQTASNVFNGRSYLWVEAEDYASLSADEDENGWKVVSKETPIESTQGFDILPANSNVSGTALLDDAGGGGHADTALYEVQFLTAGTYQLYTRHTMFDADGNGNFGNEDSFYISPAFGKNSSSDWVGFVGKEFDDAIGASPDPGFALDPDGFVLGDGTEGTPGTGDNQNEGWFATRDWGVKSMGDVTFNNNATENFWNGTFHWYNRPAYVSVNAAGTFDDDFGFKTEFTVTAEMVGQTTTFEIGNRENYVALDGFLFIQDDDVDLLDVYTQEEVDAVLAPIGATGPLADFDGDLDVDATDLAIWETGLGTAAGALKADGDANGDGAVAGGDFLVWQEEHGTGPAAAAHAVPEPASLSLLALLALGSWGARRRTGRNS